MKIPLCLDAVVKVHMETILRQPQINKTELFNQESTNKMSKITRKIIYENLDEYYTEMAVIGGTMKVAGWKKRPLYNFRWGYYTSELQSEANELNRLQKELQQKQAIFHSKLKATMDDKFQPKATK